MRYSEFGTTGVSISALGFGAMRLPVLERDSSKAVDEDASIQTMHRAFELGVNYVDTAYGYCGGQSEIVVGKALKAWKGAKVYASTKIPLGKVSATDDYRRLLDEQLRKLDLSCIDFYHFHGLGARSFHDKVLQLGLLDEAVKARKEGLIGHISFSFHDKPQVMKEIIDTGVFESVLCQYNLLDRSNEESICYARSKGLGVVVMGPVGGGRLGKPSDAIQSLLSDGRKSTPHIALRFVLANKNVNCALSGMSTREMVEENAETASISELLSGADIENIEAAMNENQRLADLYCTGCNYCLPCPSGVAIPRIFKAMNYHRVYKITDFAREEYARIGSDEWNKGKKADACVECGICEEKCPQKIEIRRQLKECREVLGLPRQGVAADHLG